MFTVKDFAFRIALLEPGRIGDVVSGEIRRQRAGIVQFDADGMRVEPGDAGPACQAI